VKTGVMWLEPRLRLGPLQSLSTLLEIRWLCSAESCFD
jgi:hypothetical protein